MCLGLEVDNLKKNKLVLLFSVVSLGFVFWFFNYMSIGITEVYLF